jgi:acetaldehyde dehydrogenase
MSKSVLNVAIIGTGKIGCDLLTKVLKIPQMNCCLFVGRRIDSEGLKYAQQLNVSTSAEGIESLEKISAIDLVFDATSAHEHEKNKVYFLTRNIKVVNLTPALMNFKCVPAINLHEAKHHKHVSMVTCGCQASLPIAFALTKAISQINYLEVVTSIASSSAGQATRQNIGQYQTITETTITEFTSIKNVKSILIINPASPPVCMQTTIYATAKEFSLSKIIAEVNNIVKKVKTYIPGYQLITPPFYDDGRIVIMLKITGQGDYLSAYSGNLDIINSAAIEVAKIFYSNT